MLLHHEAAADDKQVGGCFHGSHGLLEIASDAAPNSVALHNLQRN
jgi:hypothetical protein